MSDIFSLPFVKENLNVAYEFIKGKFKHPDDQYPDIGEGKLVQIDDHTYGVYRDEEEILHIVDVTCPHLGCVCHFNAMDKTWDCPCHGSHKDIRKHPLRRLLFCEQVSEGCFSYIFYITIQRLYSIVNFS